ncbi:NUDIX hydrolase [Alteromonas sp. 1_MG-2023]|uniref:NUDIX hydrolase n=1 Tax=Alteromonas sp. 1_MG-2023 TaxID=3062669 RepID=UPI0026E40B81|nr:NUDIX hydrolase [Alteromonas sp. 1_MG-2023]MDO6477008.1 NUDIX hydrolase [Alteromonas sp. 1_MG-2023]
MTIKYTQLLIAIIPCSVIAVERTHVNAGVVAYACTENGAQYLFAYDPDQKRQAWTTFGGGPKGQETASVTALREFRQESNCAFTSAELNSFELDGPSESNGFFNFVLKIPYIEISEIAKPRECEDVERSFWVWVPHRNLISALDSKYSKPFIRIDSNPPVKFYLWEGGVKSMRKVKDDGYISNDDPCGY